MKLIPLKMELQAVDGENVLIYTEDGYALAVVHMDMFYDVDSGGTMAGGIALSELITESLHNGKRVKCEFRVLFNPNQFNEKE